MVTDSDHDPGRRQIVGMDTYGPMFERLRQGTCGSAVTGLSEYLVYVQARREGVGELVREKAVRERRGWRWWWGYSARGRARESAGESSRRWWDGGGRALHDLLLREGESVE